MKAWLMRRPPATVLLQAGPPPLFHLWLAYAGLLLFAGALLYWHGVWAALLGADPTFLTAIIVVLFAACTLWAGRRALEIERQHMQLESFAQALAQGPEPARQWLEHSPACWARDHFRAIVERGAAARDSSALTELLAEKASTPHEMGWWINGVLLKLGLLGKVIGFSIMAMQLGSLEAFDPSQTAAILKTLTGGLGIALLTTITGLTANILLGLQLVRLDRHADHLTARAIEIAQTRLGTLLDTPAVQTAQAA
jgi:hypothetical protein